MTKLTFEELPQYFDTVRIYPDMKTVFAAEHLDDIKSQGEIFSFKYNEEAEISDFNKAPYYAAIMPSRMGNAPFEDTDNVLLADIPKVILAALENKNKYRLERMEQMAADETEDNDLRAQASRLAIGLRKKLKLDGPA